MSGDDEGSCSRLRVVAVCALLAATSHARASDFWDEVRNPGLSAHRAHLARAAAALADNRPVAALQHADAAVAQLPDRAGGHALRGVSLGALARHGEATAAFDQALARDAHALDADAEATAAAESAMAVGRADLALRVTTRLLAKTRNARVRSRALLMLADALQLCGPTELRRAVAAYREALVDDAHEKQALLGLALALHRGGEHDEAIALAQRAGVKPAPSWLPGYEYAARTALWSVSIGDRAGAAQAWLRAAEGGHPWTDHARLALSLAQKGGEP